MFEQGFQDVYGYGQQPSIGSLLSGMQPQQPLGQLYQSPFDMPSTAAPDATGTRGRDWGKILQAVAAAASLVKRREPPELRPVNVGQAGEIGPQNLLAAYQALAQRGQQGATFPMASLGALLRGQ